MSEIGRFAVLRCAVEIELGIRAEGPILVRGPDAFVPDAPDMAFIRMPTPDGEVPYLPGSSLKGVLRSGAEMLLRGLGTEACVPMDTRPPGGCGRCFACLAFGSSSRGAAVILVGDGMPWPPGATDEERRRAAAATEARRAVRTGVAIDRHTGSVAGGQLFDMEVLAGPTFFPTITARNPEERDLAIVAAALDLLDAGILRIGSGTTKGLGRVRVEPRKVRVAAADPDLSRRPLAGVVSSSEQRGPLWWSETADPSAALRTWADELERALGRGEG